MAVDSYRECSSNPRPSVVTTERSNDWSPDVTRPPLGIEMLITPGHTQKRGGLDSDS